MAFPVRIGDGNSLHWGTAGCWYEPYWTGDAVGSLRAGGRGVNGLYPLLQPRAPSGVGAAELSEVPRC